MKTRTLFILDVYDDLSQILYEDVTAIVLMHPMQKICGMLIECKIDEYGVEYK